MAKTASKVLKASEVKLDGKFQIGAKPIPSAGAKQNAAQKPSQIVRANIVESNQQFAVLEIICSCGAKGHIKCLYSNQNDQSN